MATIVRGPTADSFIITLNDGRVLVIDSTSFASLDIADGVDDNSIDIEGLFQTQTQMATASRNSLVPAVKVLPSLLAVLAITTSSLSMMGAYSLLQQRHFLVWIREMGPTTI